MSKEFKLYTPNTILISSLYPLNIPNISPYIALITVYSSCGKPTRVDASVATAACWRLGLGFSASASA